MSVYPAPPPMHHRFMTVSFVDVATADSVWVVPGFRGRIRKIHSVIDGALTGANTAITVEIGGVAVTGAALTIAFSGSAAGDVDSADVPIGSTNSFTPTQAIEVITDGAGTGPQKAWVTLELEPV